MIEHSYAYHLFIMKHKTDDHKRLETVILVDSAVCVPLLLGSLFGRGRGDWRGKFRPLETLSNTH